jgi:POT family proton-dependent oligopeptide transporter
MNQSTQRTQSTLLGHPKGLFILSLTEMWERFSFYGMRALLVLFLTDRLAGGMGWAEPRAYELYGIYTMAIYVLGILGGAAADRYIGQKSAVLWGGILACIGHFLLAIPSESIFMLGLCFIAIGVGLLKPNISTMVGSLYAQGDPRRDSGFTIFYMGINIGALLCAVIVGYIGKRYGWHYGFGSAGFGMMIGIVTFLLGQRHLGNIGDNPRLQEVGPGLNFTLAKQPFSREDKDRLLVLALSFTAVFIFFAAFEQAGGLMNLFTEKYTNRYVLGWQIPASMFQGLNPAFVILLGPVVAIIWTLLAKRYNPLSSIFKMGLGNLIVGIGFLFMIGASLEKSRSGIEQSSLHWLISAYLFHTLGELCLSPVSLSFITKVSPKSISGSMMGTYFAVVGLANYLAAWLGKTSVAWGELTIFQLIFWITLVIGLVFIVFNKKLNQLTHGAEETIEIGNL